MFTNNNLAKKTILCLIFSAVFFLLFSGIVGSPPKTPMITYQRDGWTITQIMFMLPLCAFLGGFFQLTFACRDRGFLIVNIAAFTISVLFGLISPFIVYTESVCAVYLALFTAGLLLNIGLRHMYRRAVGDYNSLQSRRSLPDTKINMNKESGRK